MEDKQNLFIVSVSAALRASSTQESKRKFEQNMDVYYIQDEAGTIHKITEKQAEKIKNNMESQYD